jgi:CelD/BcsL family acetyltransferase involved in cellulose biosynthesis
VSDSVVRIEPSGDPRWDRFVAEHDQGSIFHTAAWSALLQKTYGFHPAHLAYQRNGALEGVLPLLLVDSRLTGRRLVSLPFSAYAGPLASTPVASEALVTAAIDQARTLGRCRLRIHSRDDLPSLTDRRLSSVQAFVCSVIPLDADLDVVWRQIPRRGLRAQIRAAGQRGVRVQVSDDRRDLARAYDLFLLTSRKHGVPPPPASFFEDLWELLRPSGACQLFLTTLDDQLVHARLALRFKDVLYSLAIGIDDRSLRLHAGKLAEWGCIEWACLHGCRSFDLLRSHVSNEGLRSYKRGFGAYELGLRSYSYPTARGGDSLRERLMAHRRQLAFVSRPVLGCLPRPWLRLLARFLYRQLA